ncbi:unnamed protein product [Porites lobata]|uniref:Uncharacterized protein n=1 Tax=Porites lobata TaxID=104759 RepID=A0ABN8NGB1_9CNID|nr:unnamed protein product [Porites lobata]
MGKRKIMQRVDNDRRTTSTKHNSFGIFEHHGNGDHRKEEKNSCEKSDPHGYMRRTDLHGSF